MAPPSSATARRAATPQPRPSSRRPALRVVQPERRRGIRAGGSRRAPVWLAVGLVVGSLLVVVVGDTMVAQGQVRLAKIQLAIAAQQATQKSMQTEVAQLAAPDRIVAQAIAHGLTAPAQVVNLPEVPLTVPLPVPDTSPAGALPAVAAPATAQPAAGTTATPATGTATPATTLKPATAAPASSTTPPTPTTPTTIPR